MQASDRNSNFFSMPKTLKSICRAWKGQSAPEPQTLSLKTTHENTLATMQPGYNQMRRWICSCPHQPPTFGTSVAFLRCIRQKDLHELVQGSKAHQNSQGSREIKEQPASFQKLDDIMVQASVTHFLQRICKHWFNRKSIEKYAEIHELASTNLLRIRRRRRWCHRHSSHGTARQTPLNQYTAMVQVSPQAVRLPFILEKTHSSKDSPKWNASIGGGHCDWPISKWGTLIGGDSTNPVLTLVDMTTCCCFHYSFSTWVPFTFSQSEAHGRRRQCLGRRAASLALKTQLMALVAYGFQKGSPEVSFH